MVGRDATGTWPAQPAKLVRLALTPPELEVRSPETHAAGQHCKSYARPDPGRRGGSLSTKLQETCHGLHTSERTTSGSACSRRALLRGWLRRLLAAPLAVRPRPRSPLRVA